MSDTKVGKKRKRDNGKNGGKERGGEVSKNEDM